MIPLYIHMYLLFFKFFSYLGCYIILTRVSGGHLILNFFPPQGKAVFFVGSLYWWVEFFCSALTKGVALSRILT